MATTATIPIAIAPEAAERVAELGLNEQFRRMIDQVYCLVPGLVEIHVMLVPDYDEGGDPGIVMRGLVDSRAGGDRGSWRRWREWLTSAYPPAIYQHFTLMTPSVE